MLLPAGQETFEDAGTEIWAFSVATGLRGYRLELEAESRRVQVTPDALTGASESLSFSADPVSLD